MSTTSEIAADYGNAIRDLKCNNKTQINMLTILAEDYKDVSPTIVDVLETEILESPPSRKILLLYVLDSIIKNIPESGQYRHHFAKNIAKIFTHVFEESGEKTRALLYKLRQTWVEIFSAGKLHDIDMRVHSIDGAWPLAPIVSQSTSAAVVNRSTVHVNPKFFKKNGNDDSVPTASDASKRQLTAAVVKSEPHDSETVVPPTTRQAERHDSSDKSSTDKPMAKTSILKSTTNQRPVKIEDDQQSHQHTSSTTAVKESDIIAKPSVEQDQSPPIAKPPTKPRTTGKKSLPMTHKFEKRRKVVEPTHVPAIIPTPTLIGTPSAGGSAVSFQRPIPTASSVSGVDGRPAAAHPVGGSESWRLHPPPVVVPNGGMLLNSVGMPVAATTAAATVNESWRSQASTTTTSTISNETPRLPRLPTNNRVFIDGKAYEVIFLCDVPVIIRNGLPHRVSFSGPPRDIMIDGVLHKLAFGEVKTVIIDNEPHPIRFGAPSREFYMRDKAFRGVFGGPPIIVSIDGRRHEIRLLGPPPEAKIEQDPSYELTRYMTTSTAPSVSQQKPSFHIASMTPMMSGGAGAAGGMMMPSNYGPPPVADPASQNKNMFNEVNTLLKKLRYSGILGAIANQKKPAEVATMPQQHVDIRNSNSPPIPSTQRLDNIERRPAPMSALDQFSMRSLAVRYDSVIDAMLKDRVECPSCGIAIKELYGEAYHQHTTWHMRVLKGDAYTRSRPWFMCNEWFTYSETDLANRVVATEAEKVAEDKTIGAVGSSTVGDALSSDIETNECYVCNEKFEEYFDEDDDAWKLRDCVLIDGKACHRYCKTDAALSAE